MQTPTSSTRTDRPLRACIGLAAALICALSACTPSAHSAKLPKGAVAQAETPVAEASSPAAAPVTYFGEQYEDVQRTLNSRPAEPAAPAF